MYSEGTAGDGTYSRHQEVMGVKKSFSLLPQATGENKWSPDSIL
jgi:hypothetical protein